MDTGRLRAWTACLVGTSRWIIPLNLPSFRLVNSSVFWLFRKAAWHPTCLRLLLGASCLDRPLELFCFTCLGFSSVLEMAMLYKRDWSVVSRSFFLFTSFLFPMSFETLTSSVDLAACCLSHPQSPPKFCNLFCVSPPLDLFVPASLAPCLFYVFQSMVLSSAAAPRRRSSLLRVSYPFFYSTPLLRLGLGRQTIPFDCRTDREMPVVKGFTYFFFFF